MTRKSRRLVLISAALATLGLAATIVLAALRDNVVFFYGPTELAQKVLSPNTRLRIGGLVKAGTLQRMAGNVVLFTVTDKVNDVKVAYTGLLPDLFREGQGVVAEGVLKSPGQFAADNVLAKHDETYMPRDVADALKKQGTWQGKEASK